MTQSLPLANNQSLFMDADSKNLLSGISTRLNEIDLKLSFVIDLLNNSSANTNTRPNSESMNLPAALAANYRTPMSVGATLNSLQVCFP